MAQNQRFDLRLFLPYLLNQAAEASSLAFQQVYKNRYGMLRSGMAGLVSSWGLWPADGKGHL